MVFWVLQIGPSIMGIAVTMKVKEDKNGEEKERPNRSLDEFFFSKDSISNIHSPKRTQRHRQSANELVVGCLFPRARLPIARVCVCLK